MKRELIPGIYCIICIPTRQVYIGSSNSVNNRLKEHKTELRFNRHGNRYLQGAWNNFGEENFAFEVVQIMNDVNLIKDKESNYIASFNNCFNICHSKSKRSKKKMLGKAQYRFRKKICDIITRCIIDRLTLEDVNGIL